MLLTLLSLTLQSGAQTVQQTSTQAQTETKTATQTSTQTQTETKTATQTPAKTEKYAGGYYLFIVKGSEKWSFELPKDKTIDKETFKKELSGIKGVKEVQFDEKTKTWTVKVDKEDEVVKVINKYGFIKHEKKTETK